MRLFVRKIFQIFCGPHLPEVTLRPIFIENKHWGCKGSLIIDARIKPHHAPELSVDKHVLDKVDELFHSVACLKPFA